MEDNVTEQLVWKSRELLIRTRVLQSQLNAALQAKEATEKISQSESNSITTTDDGKLRHLRSKQEEKLVSLNQLNNKLKVAKSQISSRNKQMIQDLWDIYPIIEFPDRKGYSICDIHLPSSEHFEGHDETMVSVAIGYVCHLLMLLSDILDIILRFPLRYYGSKSFIYCNRRNQYFPLHVDSFKGREWVNFSYGMSLLNLNIVQIRTLYGLSTSEPDETLANLHGLKRLLDEVLLV